MPAYIIKPKPDEDFYIRYSTIVDCPTLWGSRYYMQQHLHGDEGHDARFERADKHGTSCIEEWPLNSGNYWYGWHRTELMIREGIDWDNAPENACSLTIPRDQLKEFCERTGTRKHWVTEPMIGTWDYWDEGGDQ